MHLGVNLAFNATSRFISALCTFICIPIYLSVLGKDNFSLVAFSLIMGSFLLLLDLGISAAVTREMARSDLLGTQKGSSFKTFEIVYITIMCLCGLSGLLLSKSISRYFVDSQDLDPLIEIICIKLIFLDVGTQLLIRFYMATLNGLEKQVTASIYNVTWTLLRYVGAIFALSFDSSLVTFFSWQLASGVVMLLPLALVSRRLMPVRDSKEWFVFDLSALKRARSLASGMIAVSIVSVAGTQSTSLFISSFRPSDDLVVYSIVTTLSTTLLLALQPIMTVLTPRFTAFATTMRRDSENRLFVQASIGMVSVVVPLSLTMILFPSEVLFAWTGNIELANTGASILVPLVITNSIIALAALTHPLAIANGFTKYHRYVGLISLTVALPTYAYLAGSSSLRSLAYSYCLIQTIAHAMLMTLIIRRFLTLNATSYLIRYLIAPTVMVTLAGVLLSELAKTVSMFNDLNPIVEILGFTSLLGFSSVVINLVNWMRLDKHFAPSISPEQGS